MSDCTLPHAPYIDAVTSAFEEVGLVSADSWADDCDTRGTRSYLRAVLRFTPEETAGVKREQWPHGLLLIWEWHTGIEADQGEPERGPVWLWATCLSDGSNSDPEPLLVDGYADLLQLGFALAELIRVGRPEKRHNGEWADTAALAAACEAWAVAESQ
ncbi:hypothetical protein [Streptomyces noursei]|uniref:hypothetical protein n=1 Tax=Streptomyces noursei TaxID=1971 RepID=UPI0016749D8E|nr:hypothetical protein [Streptomyces noursei]MCZ1013917.1 hypothetical protein [Streptomyces noursei]GGX40887.1 hypothetical protein GCM10010341_73580 [Streptomyces noursei]